MKIPDFEQDGVLITHKLTKTTHEFQVNGYSIILHCFTVNETTTKGDTQIKTSSRMRFFEDNITELPLDEFFVFKKYWKFIKPDLFLWDSRPRDFEHGNLYNISKEDFLGLIAWVALSEDDRKELTKRYIYLFEETESSVTPFNQHKTVLEKTCVYLMRDEQTGYLKIGRSVSPEYREKTLLSQSPSITLICYWSDCERSDETDLHSVFAEKRIRGEWFSLTDEDVATIEQRFEGKEKVTVTENK